MAAGDNDRDAAQIDGLHRILPLAVERDEQREPPGESRETRPAETPAGKGEGGYEQRPGLGDHEPLDRNEHVEQERGLDRIDGVEVVHVEPPYRLAPPRRGRKLQRRWIDRHRGKEQPEDIDSGGERKQSR